MAMEAVMTEHGLGMKMAHTTAMQTRVRMPVCRGNEDENTGSSAHLDPPPPPLLCRPRLCYLYHIDAKLYIFARVTKLRTNYDSVILKMA